MRNMTTVTQSPQSEIALRYFDRWSKKDYEGSAAYLAEDLRFKGPIDTFDNKTEYLNAIGRVGQIVIDVRKHRTFVDGNDVLQVYDLVTNTPAGTVPCAEWIHVDKGKVTSIQVFFDARPFAAMFAKK